VVNPFITRKQMLEKWGKYMATHERGLFSVSEFAEENHISHMRAADDPLIQFDVRCRVHKHFDNLFSEGART